MPPTGNAPNERIMQAADAYAVAATNAEGAAAARLDVWNEIEALYGQLQGAVEALREARQYVEAWADEYQPGDGHELLDKIDALLRGR